QMPENLGAANRDTRRPPKENNGAVPGSFGYDSHYCSLDRTVDPTIVACSEFQSGLRVFDIGDVRSPREIGYFNPGGDGHAAPVGAVKKAWRSPELDGKIYAQPLVAGDHVIAVTEGGSVYALDRSTGTVAWRAALGRPVNGKSLPCGNIDPSGITGTPVVDV